MKKKQSKLQSSGYILLHKSFTEWLQLLNYSPFSIPGLSIAVEEFLQYQEQNNKPLLEQLTATDANEFIELLQNKIGVRTGKPFSNNHINKYIQALKLFSRYIRETGKSITGFTLQRLEDKRTKPSWLTKDEVQRLYDAIKDDLLGIRDKAMLAVFYGCGLRLNEGASLEVSDIHRAKKIVHVRKGKNYKERFVPIAEKNFEALQLYIDYARPQLLQQPNNFLFIGAHTGKQMNRQSLYVRIKILVKTAGTGTRSGDGGKQVGTHTLRHSIATHLLQSGMKLERIKEFLGHANSDSTQLYTHLANETVPDTSRWKPNSNKESNQ